MKLKKHISLIILFVAILAMGCQKQEVLTDTDVFEISDITKMADGVLMDDELKGDALREANAGNRGDFIVDDDEEDDDDDEEFINDDDEEDDDDDEEFINDDDDEEFTTGDNTLGKRSYKGPIRNK